MLNSLKKWTLVTAVFGCTLLLGGCLGLGGQKLWLLTAILQEDLLG